MRYSKRRRKSIAVMLFIVFAGQVFTPNIALALTSGPSQPEVQSFEPVGTTDMVDMFSGDFVYNIPLLDVEGYPVNISYHGGVTMEQEASWVGLGWNINPGEINRAVRGVPDDFNGDTLTKELNIKDEHTLRVGIGVGGEIVGAGDPFIGLSLSAGMNVNISNYRGVSSDLNIGGGINVIGCASLGVNIGVGSQTGASIDISKSLSFSTSLFMSKDISAGIGVTKDAGYSTRSGIKALNYSASLSVSAGGASGSSSSSITVDKTMPIALQNYVPVITNSSTMNTIYGRIKLGGELFWLMGYGSISGMYNTLHYNNDGSREAYGYLYLQNAYADNNAIMDFTRDKDGMFNKSMQYLPSGSMTYDIYSISGQGTGGIFRPFRNDFGSVFDPAVYSDASSNSLMLEGGIGDIFELGADFTTSGTEITSGPWLKYQRNFTKDTLNSIYENVYFKQAGELSSVDPSYYASIGEMNAITPEDAMALPDYKPNSRSQRDARGNLIYYFTGEEAATSGVGTPTIMTYAANDFSADPVATVISRDSFPRKHDQISTIVQLQPTGKRYVYGLPAMNNIEKEATFSVDPTNVRLAEGTVKFTPGTEDEVTNNEGIDHYYSSTVTPGYAHSFLLTSVLSTDYVDVTGNGPTDDDLGSYTKLKYSRREKDYRWKAPYEAGIAQYNPGFWSDKQDDKGSYVIGSREQWMVHSIESKNFIAEFYTSVRDDGLGATDAIAGSYAGGSSSASSYKLDSIKLYNKHERFIQGSNAVPIKTVMFVYDYSLCKGVTNSSTGDGKLTLNAIYFRYGNSDRSMMSPYKFKYTSSNPHYNLANKDRWGNYKITDPAFTNYEFPYVDQNDSTAAVDAAKAWSLYLIQLPSGGLIGAQYEPDDYAFVQDKQAQEMFMIKGVGSGPEYSSGNQLYHDKNSPYLYAYFNRRIASEISGLSFADNYFNGQSCLYYNFNVKLSGKKTSYEQIKGYANIEHIGACSDGIHGYIKMKAVTPTGGEGHLNPVSFTALNVGRYNLPQIIFPGSDPDASDLHNVLAGLKGSFEELASITHNPIIQLIKRNQAKDVNLNKSYIRLQSVGLHKKGGGQRVQLLAFYDSWAEMTGSTSEQSALYGKTYDYTIKDPSFGLISSGVASYEPLIGGDENPFRTPVDFTLSAGSSWPPNDPVDLYQENPIGESLFPSASVGYRKVTVKSMHKDVGKSSQGVDVYQYYTAKDFPLQVKTTNIVPNESSHYDLFSQKNLMDATQGYCLVFNDMHGKPKSVEHQVYNPTSGTTRMISSQVFNYKQSGGKLDNNVNCLVYQPGVGMTVQSQQLGIEADVTIDTRQKNELTRNFTINTNLNVSGIGPYIIPIPLVFPWGGEYQNQFRSATVTKVIQQYGILDNVVSNSEGAITTVKNELFDPSTGNVVTTSVNNEYHDKEYSVDVPAYWAYLGMAPAYNNVKYKFIADTVFVDSNYMGRIATSEHLNVGDELFLTGDVYRDGPALNTTAWVMGSQSRTVTYPDSVRINMIWHYFNTTRTFCDAYIVPRFPTTLLAWYNGAVIPKVHCMVIRSGGLNMLNETIESYSTMNNPISGGTLNYDIGGLINIKTRTFSDSNTRIISNYIANADTVNPYAIGERGVYRLLTEYAYLSDRNYDSTSVRKTGLFTARTFFVDAVDPKCMRFPYNYLMPDTTPSPAWTKARTITKWSPNGKEVENIDAIGNYSTAAYAYNEELPIAVASNARQGEVLAEGFEDYSLLQYTNNIMNFNYSPDKAIFPITSSPSPTYNVFDLTGGGSGIEISSTTSHTGLYSLYVGGSTTISGPLVINNNNYSGAINHYNFYYNHGYPFSSINEYLPFGIVPGKKYILSYWIKDASASSVTTSYTIPSDCGVLINGTTLIPLVKKTNLIDGWEQVEVDFNVPSGVSSVAINLPAGFYMDDFRVFPYDANMKAFVYNPVNEKLMATLDENNFATIYEYDKEGILIRTKKETEKGIMTISESRSQNHAN